MEGMPAGAAEQGQNTQPTGWENMAATNQAVPGGEALNAAAETANGSEKPAVVAEMGGAALAAVAPEATAMPEVKEVNISAVAAEGPVAGQANLAGATPAGEATKTAEAGPMADSEMVSYVLSRLKTDLALPELQAQTPEAQKKRGEIERSVGIFEDVNLELKYDQQQGLAPKPVEEILRRKAGIEKLRAEETTDEAKKVGILDQARLAEDWAKSYNSRKERRVAEQKNQTVGEAGQAPAAAGAAEPGGAPTTAEAVPLAANATSATEAQAGMTPAESAPVGAASSAETAAQPGGAGQAAPAQAEALAPEMSAAA